MVVPLLLFGFAVGPVPVLFWPFVLCFCLVWFLFCYVVLVCFVLIFFVLLLCVVVIVACYVFFVFALAAPGSARHVKKVIPCIDSHMTARTNPQNGNGI